MLSLTWFAGVIGWIMPRLHRLNWLVRRFIRWFVRLRRLGRIGRLRRLRRGLSVTLRTYADFAILRILYDLFRDFRIAYRLAIL